MTDDRRTELLDKLADHVLAEGLGAASLRPLAKAAGTSDRMLLYYFKDKDELITATLGVIAARLTAILEARKAAEPLPLTELRPALIDVLFDDGVYPYMRVWMEIASFSARGDVFYRNVAEQIARGFLAWGASQLACDSEDQRQREAAELLVALEGMLFLKCVGLEDVARKTL